MSEKNKVTIDIYLINIVEKSKQVFNELMFFSANEVKFKRSTRGKYVKYEEQKFQSLTDMELLENEFDIAYEKEEIINFFKNYQNE